MIKLHPTTDVHLLPGMSVTFDLLFNDDRTPLNDWIRATPIDFILPAGITIATMAGLTLTASATVTGTARTWLIMRVLPPPPAAPINTATVPVRITVHQTLHRLWSAAASITLETSRDDRVLVVYAEFEDSAGVRHIVDVTGRDFLDYGLPTPSFSIGADGRVTTTATPGTHTVTIGVRGGIATPVTGSVTIEVVAAPASLPILEQCHSGMEVSKRSLVFISDGFTDEQEFRLLCRLLALKLTRHNEPYARLRESLDIYSAYVPSAEEGITVGADMVQPAAGAPAFVLVPDDEDTFQGVISLPAIGHPDAPGAPVFADLAAFAAAAGAPLNDRNRARWQQRFDVWRALGSARPSRVRETAFGVTLTYPHRGAYVDQLGPAAPGTAAQWLVQSVFRRGPARTAFFPDHRLPPLLAGPTNPDEAHLPMLRAFLSRLRLPEASVTNPPFGARWLPGGDSEGLVVILCKCDLYGGVARAGAVFLSTGNQQTVGVANSTIHTTPAPQQHLLDVIAGTTSGYQRRPIMEMTDVLAHELAHTLSMGELNDEYGGPQIPPPPRNVAPEHKVGNHGNSMMLVDAQGAGTSIVGAQLRWRWPRAEAGAVVEDCFVSGTDVTFVINRSAALRWTKLTGPQPVWLRNGPLWLEDANQPPVITNPLELQLVSFDPQNQFVRCQPPAGVTAADIVQSFWTLNFVPGVPAGSPATQPTDIRIVLQRVDATSTAQWLITEPVRLELLNGPLTTNACNPLGAANRTAAVAGLRTSTPAAYEGGSGHDCLVLRPARSCKLSRRMEVQSLLGLVNIYRAEQFCAVCEYVMTYQLDVSLLPDVDRLL